MPSEFETRVHWCRKFDRAATIHISSIKNAGIVTDVIFTEATRKKKRIRLVSAALTPAFYNPLCGRLLDHLNADLEIQVIVLMPDVTFEKNEFADILRSAPKAELYQFRDASGPRNPHFIVAGSMYKMEVDYERALSKASFNDPSVSKFLHNLFRDFLPGVDRIQ